MCIKIERFIYKLTHFMCMKIDKESLLRINKGFGGNLLASSSLDFAISKQNDKKIGEFKKLAYLIRAILVDHPFSDGNKRTATYLILTFTEKNNKRVDIDLLEQQVVSISRQNIIDIINIERRLKNAIR